MSKISLDLLDKNRKEILFKLKPFFLKGGVLAGGTALMLQFYYRKSYDFDLFFPFQLPEDFLRLASRIFNLDIQVLINNSGELTFTVSNKIKSLLFIFPLKENINP